MTDESGSYDVRKLRSEQRRQLSLPITWAVIVAAAGACITWGVTSQRLTEIERRQSQTEIDQRQVENRMAGSETEVAVVKAQYTEIIRRLDNIDAAIRGDPRGRR